MKYFKIEVINRYDGIMLPPDKENKGVFGILKDKVFSYIKNPYSDSMLEKYLDITIEAMLYEIQNEQFQETYLFNFLRIYKYLKSVFNPIQNIVETFKSGFFNFLTSRDYFIQVNIYQYNSN